MTTLLEKILNESKVVSFPKRNNNVVILIGGSGSGKSYVISQLIDIDARVLNSDKFLSFIAKRDNIDMKNPDELGKLYHQFDPKFDEWFTNFVKNVNKGENIIIDTTGRNYPKFKKVTELFKSRGYTVTFVYVDVDLETAIERNKMRDRQVPEDAVRQIHADIRANIRKFHKISDHFWVVLNETGADFRKGKNIIKLK